MGILDNANKEQKDFYRHLSIYVIVNIALVFINLMSAPDTIWFIWPLFGWGIGIAFHALNVFVFKDYEDSDNKESKS